MMNKAFSWIKKQFHPGSLILMYHRVNDVDSDPWALCVQPNNFAEHLEVLRKEAVPLSLQAFVRAHQERRLPHRAVAVTFDDGYADNLFNAKPILERFEIPATIFVTSGYIGSKRELWWDELEQVLLSPCALPETLQLTIGRKSCRWELGRSARYGEDNDRFVLKQKAWEGQPGSRHHLYHAVWQALRLLNDCERRHALDAVTAWAGVVTELRDGRRTLSVDELQALARCDLIDIGAHSVSHPFFPAQLLSVQTEEIRESKARLERLLVSPVTSFAYPHGEYSRETLSIVKEAGFACACTTEERAARLDVNCLALPRFQIEDWDGEEFSRRLQAWFRG
jgi:peptidoglycan/xylan/chitin deacetylase (PgdA/CDA1 family)